MRDDLSLVDWACNPNFPSTFKFTSTLDVLSGRDLFDFTLDSTIAAELAELHEINNYDTVEINRLNFTPSSLDTMQVVGSKISLS